jgi:phospholipase D-like protein
LASSVVSERTILAVVRPLLASAKKRIWVTAPWVTSSAAGLFFGEVVARLRAGTDLDVRVVYRLKGADDLSISDLDALDQLAAAGCKVRYSNRLHAKVVIVDDTDAVVSSSNLTSTAGYSVTSGAWQNEELGVHLTGERNSVAQLAAEFEQIWSDAHILSDRTVGITLDETTSATVRVACIRPPVVGEFVVVGASARTVGQVTSVSSYNPTVPAELGDTDTILGLRGGGGGRRSTVPDVQTLFSHPSKTHAFLMAQTFVKSAATYYIAGWHPPPAAR